MPQPLAGPGQGLPLQVVYPASLYGAPFIQRGNTISLAPGQVFNLPANGTSDIWIEGFIYCVLQVQDPVTGIWRGLSTVRRGPMRLQADGFNYRIANFTGCVVGATVTNGGSGWVQATTTVTPATGNSTWLPIVGGSVSITVVTAGSGYSIPPIIAIDPPPAGAGVQATAVATLSSGTISAITNINQGAGYLTAPNVQVIPVPTDPNYVAGSVTNGTAGAAIISGDAGKLIAVLCTNNGDAVASAPTLTIGGAGVTATVASLWMSTVTGVTVTGAGTTISASNFVYSGGGGNTNVAAWASPGNPMVEYTGFIPRPFYGQATVGTGTITTVTTIYDSGLFLSTPSLVFVQGAAIGTPVTLTPAMGSVNDTGIIQLG